MKNRKRRLVSLMLVVMVLLGSMITGHAQESDIRGHWAEAVMSRWIQNRLLNGYGNQVYRPDGHITRAEFITLVNKVNGFTQTSDAVSIYQDVDKGDWFYEEIAKALAAGYILGTSQSTMSPEALLTRQEAMTIVLRAKGIQPAQEVSILASTIDGAEAAGWARGYVAEAMLQGYVNGNEGRVTPLSPITRAETVSLLDKVLTDSRTYAFAATYGPDTGTKTVNQLSISTSGVVVQNLVVNGDLEITPAVGDGEVTLNNVVVKGDIHVRGGGINSIYFNNVDVLGSLVVNKLDGKVRILATGNSNVALTVLESGAILVTREITGGGFENILILEDILAGQDVVLQGDFTKLTNRAAELNLTLNGSLGTLETASSLNIQGVARINQVQATGNARVTGATLTVTTPSGSTGGTSGAGGSGGSSGSGGSGGNGNGSDDDDETPAVIRVTDVQINQESLSLLAGETAQLTATVTPANATDQRVVWASTPSAIAIVAADGQVTAREAGTAQVTVSTVDGGFSNEVTVTVYPAGTVLIRGIGEITGTLEVNETVTAGPVQTTSGTAILADENYQWYRSNQAHTGFTEIPGATGPEYTITEHDQGYYFKVKAFGNGTDLFGEAFSHVYGPVPLPVTAEEIFALLKTHYLGENTDANYITKNLNLVTSLEAYPLITITWTSSEPGVVAPNGAITRQENGDVDVLLTATLAGAELTGSALSKDFPVKVLAQGIENVDLDGTDARFKPGYPKASIENGEITISFELTEPAKVYMVVNVINGHRDSTRAAVLSGYAGDVGYPLRRDSSPYFEVDGNQLLKFNSGVQLTGDRRDARIHFVLTDMADDNIGEVVTIHFDLETIAALDETPPSVLMALINQAKDTLYVYFTEFIEVPASFDYSQRFTLGGTGQVTGGRYGNYTNVPTRGGYIALEVTGITDLGSLSLAYQHDDASPITDISVNANRLPGFTGQTVIAATVTADEVVIGNDGRSMLVSLNNGINIADQSHARLGKEDFLVQLTTGSAIEIQPSDMAFSTSYLHMQYYLSFEEALDNVAQVTVRLTKETLVDYAYDSYPANLVVPAEEILNLSHVAAEPQGITYNKSSGSLLIDFDPALQFASVSVAGDNFTIKIGEAEYTLRGFPVRTTGSGNQIQIRLSDDPNDHYMKAINDLLASATASSVTIKYEPQHGEDVYSQICDAGGALLPGFGYQPVDME